jgi:REP-associated tyrosine transposase
MANDQSNHHRRSVRLQDYNYSQSGAYFVTICTKERACMFGKIVDGAMQLNDAGRIVDQCWLEIPNHFPQVDLDVFLVMPNHVHGIIVIAEGPVGAKNFSPLQKINNTRYRPSGAPSKSVGSIIRGLKIGVTK